jgi:hypothetical protein
VIAEPQLVRRSSNEQILCFELMLYAYSCYCGCAGGVTGGVRSGGVAGGVCSGTVPGGGVAVVSVGGVAGSKYQTTSSAMTTAAAMMSNLFLSMDSPCSPAIKVSAALCARTSGP